MKFNLDVEGALAREFRRERQRLGVSCRTVVRRLSEIGCHVGRDAIQDFEKGRRALKADEFLYLVVLFPSFNRIVSKILAEIKQNE